jgi:hypothetical protein
MCMLNVDVFHGCDNVIDSRVVTINCVKLSYSSRSHGLYDLML